MIKDLVKQVQTDMHFVICTLDPLDRWVSAFGWDYHTYALKKQFFTPKRATDLLKRFRSWKSLAHGIYANNPEAIELAHFKHHTFGHMAMGQNWYLPEDIVNQIPIKQESLIRVEKIDEDIRKCIISIKNQFKTANKSNDIKVGDMLSNYRSTYRNNIFRFKPDLDVHEIEAIKNILKKDYLVNERLFAKLLPK